MAKPWESYEQVVIEIYEAVKSGKSSHIHARPVEGQKYPTDLDCSRKMRSNHPVGTKFRVWAKLTDREGGGEYLYTSWRWPYEVVS
ncbi:MAG: hypothetical protein CME84_14930 [Henriciella sp.]|nr:hypothetical protein [Henriciella sp.]|tara:strand:- start:1007 stop:1264 length:258 start_codon:yes stop_codon:yes gene_type:complete